MKLDCRDAGGTFLFVLRQYVSLFVSMAAIVSLLLTSDRKSSHWYGNFAFNLQFFVSTKTFFNFLFLSDAKLIRRCKIVENDNITQSITIALCGQIYSHRLHPHSKNETKSIQMSKFPRRNVMLKWMSVYYIIGVEIKKWKHVVFCKYLLQQLTGAL